ncbi:fungal-specific transcription factor domain-containing protein [Exophiala viscosa]|uniref:Fungal-specific transcription factor domain-containing protein n=1 Tax=Exophiala viscosa TaxID=2486360 RepID=A0AAN6I913_9EURO|nr:fungal-specific transcription factor domain-containing protein [Exophiala viscosa]
MEALLESSVTAKSTPTQGHVEPDTAQKTPPAPLEKEVSNLVINDAGEQKFIGSSSGLSLFSPRGLAWIQRKLGSDKMVAIFRKVQQRSPMWPSIRFGRQSNEPSDIYPFPPREIAVYLVDCYFKTFNAVYPLFSRDTFWELFERQYSDTPPPDGSWISALSIVLSIGCTLATDAVLRNISMVDPSFTSNLMDIAWKYFKNASSMIPTLLFIQYDLLTVQTLIGMAYIMQTQMHPEGAFLLIGIAARVCSSLGLHRHLESFGLTESESYQRQRVFWILCVIDKDMSIRIGRPSAIDDDDAEIEIVSQPSQGEISIPVTGERSGFYPFQSLCSLALIQSRIFHELYAAKARNNTTAERLESISKLDAELHNWKEQIPSEIRPENPIYCDKEFRHSVLQLHYSYYHCLTAIHRVNAHHELWASEDTGHPDSQKSTPSSGAAPDDDGSKHRTQSSYALCLMSARSSLLLTVSYLDEYDVRNKLIWLAPYFPVTSFLALFTHILHNPLDSRAAADLALMAQTITSLHKLVGTDDRTLFSFITNVLDDSLQIAKQHVQDSQAKSSPQNSIANVTSDVTIEAPNKSQFATGQQAVFNMPTSSMSLPTQVNNAATSGMGQQPLNAVNTFAVPQTFDPTYQPDFDFNNLDFTTQLANQGQYNTQGMMSMDDPFLLLEYGEWDWTY